MSTLNIQFLSSTNCILEIKKNKRKYSAQVEQNDFPYKRVCKLNDIEKVKDIFRTDEIRKIKSTTKEPIWEVRTNINGVEVQIMAENFTGEYVSKLLAGRTTRVKIDNIDVPCFTLDAEAQAYSETNREHKAEIIHEFLKKRFK